MKGPIYIQPFYKIEQRKKYGNCTVSGKVLCCENEGLEINYYGNLKKDISGKLYFMQNEDRIVLDAVCKGCFKKIHLFDSLNDGYDNCLDTNDFRPLNVAGVLNNFFCKKCNSNVYEVNILYEYPEIEEMENLNILNKENSFIWIKISLKCKKCKKVYKNIVDFEMG